METFLLERQDLPAFLNACEAHRRVHIPVEMETHHFIFKPLAEAGAASVALHYLRTALPPKKYFFPPEEVLYRFDAEGYTPQQPDLPPMILFGLHPCDLHGVDVVDHFFARDYPDRTYQNRRSQAWLIGLGCMPDAHCFCQSQGTEHVDGLYDMFLWDLGPRFYVMVRTEAGHDMLHMARALFKPVTDSDRQSYLALLKKRQSAFQLSMPVADLPQVLEVKQDCAVWGEIAQTCFTCGACSMVCPTCTCYDMLDRLELNGECGTRCRTWSSCLFRDFDRGAGDHHFRRDRGDRVKNRYYHKEHGYVNGFGKPSCVGCGRCITSCPAGIDVVSVFTKVRRACGHGGEETRS
ncbi:4Fe-4S ferredoxin, iron-sulfur binding domain protein [Magnetococcus marinus MC-1]|uniref:4Fe-4S ferredoxin, iron-sulfur binding domain protein n=1 Tax=Magnetococcus marinus (strain ATCC BAA-1437 / JCM 17883 / MC-1) TaxID=156889 RepID=A0L607_MAGMM|nr:4Fe-4S dicluster domain-containing protein [Magnetococcus marinus]ABK43400.1 4Fe-4S ferredoxin, iron-sulfur binding domain protein [Magnetococcus marinus MC-1]